MMRWIAAAALLLAATSGVAQQKPVAVSSPRDTGPATLIMTYRVAPKDRLAFRRAVDSGGLVSFARMKAAGQVRDFQILWNRYVDTPSWTMMVFVEFSSPADMSRWRNVEATNPAGLRPDALALTSSIETAPADLMREHRARAVSPPSTFLVIPYDYLIGTDAYLDYVDGYVIKQAEGWIGEGALTGYRFFLGRYAAGRPWSSLLLLEYRGDEGLGARDAVVARVRRRLADDPAWLKLSQTKDKIREERIPAEADPIGAQ